MLIFNFIGTNAMLIVNLTSSGGTLWWFVAEVPSFDDDKDSISNQILKNVQSSGKISLTKNLSEFHVDVVELVSVRSLHKFS
jgi:hypothetical protein